MKTQFKKGDSVRYCPSHGGEEKGVVKSVDDKGFCFVVYNCGGEWHKYEDYTAARTNPNDLKKGWYDE